MAATGTSSREHTWAPRAALLAVIVTTGAVITSVRPIDPGLVRSRDTNELHAQRAERDPTIDAHDTVRRLRVCLVLDDEFRAHSGSQERAEALVAEASRAMATQVGVALEITSWETWESPDGASGLFDLEHPLRLDFRRRTADVVLVLVCQEGSGGTPEHGRPGDPRGLADYYQPMAIVRLDPPGPDSWAYGAETIVHEIAHCFGAWHAPTGRCVMTKFKRGEPSLVLCATTRRVFAITGRMDLRLGPGQLPSSEREELIAAFRRQCPDDTSNPVSEGYLNRAYLLELDDPTSEERAECYRRAIALYEAEAMGPDSNYALAHRMYGQVLSHTAPRQAKPHLIAARAQYLALGEEPRRVADPTLRLSWVEGRLGNRAEAERLARDALARRMRRLGRIHEQTAEAYDFHGRALIALGRTRDARFALTQADAIYGELGGFDEKHREVLRRLRKL